MMNADIVTKLAQRPNLDIELTLAGATIAALFLTRDWNLFPTRRKPSNLVPFVPRQRRLGVSAETFPDGQLVSVGTEGRAS